MTVVRVEQNSMKGGGRSAPNRWGIVSAVLLTNLMLFSAAYFGYRHYEGRKSRSTDIRVSIREAVRAVDMYYVDCKTFPSAEQGLAALFSEPTTEPKCRRWDGPYAESELKDPWGRPFIYERDGDFFVLRSLGADGKEGGTGLNLDISSYD